MLYDQGSHFKQFAVNLEKAIDKYGDMDEDTLLEHQKKQMERLASLELEFRDTLIVHPWGNTVFKGFIKYICDDRKNILAARPFFRERQTLFTDRISGVLRSRDDIGLHDFHFNYQFVQFALGCCPWPGYAKIVRLARNISDLRKELIETNMPLAISRARIFWSRTPRSQLSYMDLVDLSCLGLISAIDKFVLPFSAVWRAVVIGRITGDFIENYSSTLLHFFPGDRRKLYRANKLISKFDGDYEGLVDAINEDIDEAHQTDVSEMADLLAAASCVSADSVGPANSGIEPDMPSVNRFAAPSSCQPDLMVENYEVLSKIESAIAKLPISGRKLLKLRGVAFSS